MRRVHLALLTTLACTAALVAGPLSPPGGSVASTGRTLDEIYNKIPTVNDGRTPVSAFMTIATPGHYVLTNHITGIGPMSITADNVTLDLNGFTITHTTTASAAVGMTSGRTNVVIRNGTIAGGSIGISASNLQNSAFEDLTLIGQRVAGIQIGTTTTRNCRISRCQINDLGISTTSADTNLSLSGISVSGSTNRVEDCIVARIVYNGGGTPNYRGIAMIGGLTTAINVVARCTVYNETILNGTGILFSGSGGGVYRENSVSNFITSYSTANAVNGGGNF